MEIKGNRIDFIKLMLYILKRAWFVVLCAELGFAGMYYYSTRMVPETYTASGTIYVNNGSANLADYQYTSSYDLNSAVQLTKTYLVVVKSDKVMNAVVERLSNDYPDITTSQISNSLSMGNVSDTAVVSVISRTRNPQMSADIVNAVMEYAPDEIIRVVGAGSVEILDPAKVPIIPDARDSVHQGMVGAMSGAVIAACILALLYLLNRRITDTQDLTENYRPPVLASIQRIDANKPAANAFLLSNQSPMEVLESYAKLRMNLLYTLVGKTSHTVIVTSSISSEGKSTISSNLAISCAMGGKKVLLIDGDLRRASQREIFGIDKKAMGLSDILIHTCELQDAIQKEIRENLDLLPAGHFPPNPAELLESNEMQQVLQQLEKDYDLILIDMPPINVVADPLALSESVAGCLLMTRQNFSDHRDIKKALIAAEMTGMNVLGFVFYGENINQGGYYSRRYYKKYYSKYDYRKRTEAAATESAPANPAPSKENGMSGNGHLASEDNVNLEDAGSNRSDAEENSDKKSYIL